jgi:hypothetical protein
MTARKFIQLLVCLLTSLCGISPALAHLGDHPATSEFTIRPNGNSGDLPPMQYDPVTQGFMTADGKPYNGDITTLPVRGQDFDGFTKSVRDPKFDPDTAKQAYELYAKKDWAALEKLFNEKGLNDGWPPNRGFIDMKPGVLKAGDSFDRFGGKIGDDGKFVDTGRFVAPFGADFGGRALPQTHLNGDPVTGEKPEFKGYKILKDIPVTEGDAIPWFGQPGGGKQYELPKGGIDKLIADGYIVEITAPNLHGKTDGGDGTTNDTNNTDGGGMRGKDVYTPAVNDADRISTLTNAEIQTNILDAVGGAGTLHGGATVHFDTESGSFQMNVGENQFTVNIDTNFNASTATTAHGGDQGAAINKISVVDGQVVVTIGFSGEHSRSDMDKMAIHEFNEVADIVGQIESLKSKEGKNVSDSDIEALISQQQEASVFRPDADPSKMSESNMTAHDRAALQEMKALASEIANFVDPSGRQRDPKAEMQRLLSSMGISDISDPRVKLISDLTGVNISDYVSKSASSAAEASRLNEHLKTTEAANTLVNSLRTTGGLPSNFVTKAEAIAAGWEAGRVLNNFIPGAQIGGDVFANSNDRLPTAPGRVWYEADIGGDNTKKRKNSPGTRLARYDFVWVAPQYGLTFEKSNLPVRR